MPNDNLSAWTGDRACFRLDSKPVGGGEMPVISREDYYKALAKEMQGMAEKIPDRATRGRL